MRVGASLLFAVATGTGIACAGETDDALAMFRGTFGPQCLGAADSAAEVPEPDIYRLVFKVSADGIEADPHRMTLYRFLCMQGAYNANHVFLSSIDDENLQPVYFAQPTYDVVYEEDGGAEAGAKVLQVQLTGIASYPELANSVVDAVSGTITATSYWRGLGDASAAGEWRLVDGTFSLVRFDLDASYDGTVNPERVFNYLGPAAVRDVTTDAKRP